MEGKFFSIRNKLIKCYRLFNQTEFNDDSIVLNNKYIQLDGITFLEFSDGSIYRFEPVTENFTIKITQLSTLSFPENTVDITENVFWKKYLNKDIKSIEYLYNQSEDPYGIRFYFSDLIYFELVYIHENDYTFDALIINESPFPSSTKCSN